MSDSLEIKAPVVFSRDAVLTKAQLAAALSATERDIDRSDLPTIYITPRKPRYLYGQILDCLAERAA
jgi:hypothetical protein